MDDDDDLETNTHGKQCSRSFERKFAIAKKDDSFESIESIDLSRENSPRSRATTTPTGLGIDGRMQGAYNNDDDDTFPSWGNQHSYDMSPHERSSSVCSSVINHRTTRTDSVVEDLLSDIYDARWQSSIESDFDCGAGNALNTFAAIRVRKYTESELMAKDRTELKAIIKELQHRVQQTNNRLLRQLKTRAKKKTVIQTNCNVVTACLQAKSLKREVDAKMRFSLDPLPGSENFAQWCDAIKVANRMSGGVPNFLRRKIWLNLADNYFRDIGVDWKELKRSAFNDRSNPDDNELGIQIVKDLHRTGCSTFSGSDNDQERAVLKRVLLGYARWNKEIGYCQGFNIIAALILDVVGRKEEEALKIMIFLVDRVLPTSYFSNNLRALSVDMAVFRDLMNQHLPKLSKHLRGLQLKAQQDLTSGGYEPPLTNVFTMQWFLTLFATCLPLHAVLRIWDAIMVEGSEVVIRTALVLWELLQTKLLRQTDCADDFYTEMGKLLQDIVDPTSGHVIDVDDLLGMVYSFAPFPFTQLNRLREQYTYNITPIAQENCEKTPQRKASQEESTSHDVMTDVTRAIDPAKSGSAELDIEGIGPGVFGSHSDSTPGVCPPGVSSEGGMAMAERTSTDISKLERKYEVIKRRQSQAKIMMFHNKSRFKDVDFGKQQPARSRVTNLVIPPAPTLKHHQKGYEIAASSAVNHLYVRPDDENNRRKNRHVVPYGTTLFTDDASKGSKGSSVRYAGAYLISAGGATSGDGASSSTTSSKVDETVTKITFSDCDEDDVTAGEEEKKGNENDENNNNSGGDISKTLLELHLEWKDRQSNGEESSDSSVPSLRSQNLPTRPLTPSSSSARSLPVGIGTFSMDDIKKRQEKTPRGVPGKTRAGEDQTEAGRLSPPVADMTPPEKVDEDSVGTKRKPVFLAQHVRKEKRDFGIKLGIYKPSDFGATGKPISIRPTLTQNDRKTPRITRQHINNCLTRESFASASWGRKDSNNTG